MSTPTVGSPPPSRRLRSDFFLAQLVVEPLGFLSTAAASIVCGSPMGAAPAQGKLSRRRAAGVPITLVSDRLGHSKVSITLDIYAHAIPSHGADAARLIGGAIHGAETGS